MNAQLLAILFPLGSLSGWIAYRIVDRSSRGKHRLEKVMTIATSALLLPILGGKFGPSSLLAVYGIFTMVLVGVTLFDHRKHEIPLIVTMPGTLAGLVAAGTLLPIGVVYSLGGLLFGGGVLIATTLVEAARGKEVGGGDWKLAAMIGTFIGWPGMITALILTGVFGVAGALIMKASGLPPRPRALGPWLCAGGIVTVLLS